MSASLQNKVVVFCLPGRSFSNKFLTCWTNLVAECIKREINVIVNSQYSSVVHFARAKCLGGDVKGGNNQKPFQGQLKYDYIFWIDSDIIFSPEQVFTLLQSPHQITCGMYLMEDLKNLAVVKEWDIEYFKKNGCFNFMTLEDLEQARPSNYINVAYAGMGFMCIKNNVIEMLDYPWFYRDVYYFEHNDGWICDMPSEDVAFCRNLVDKGVDIMLDTSIRVGHEKVLTI